MGSSSRRSWRLQEFVAHTPSVNCVALGHQTGRVMVTGGKDAKVNLWAVGKHNCIMSLRGHATEIRSVQFGNTDDVVCAGSSGGVIKVWDLNAAKLVRSLSGHKAAASCTDFNPYGDFLASGSADRTIKLWDFRKKGCIYTYEGHTMAVNSLKFSPDGHWIASAGEDGLVRIVDIRGGRLLKQFSEHIFPVTSLQFHPHEFLLCSGGTDGVINFYDLENFSLVSQTDQNVGNISAMAFSKDGECLYVGTDEHLKVYSWEPARLLDMESIKWGQVKDLALTDNQMLGASHVAMNVSVYLLDLQKLPPKTSAEDSLNLPSDSIHKTSPAKSPFSYGQSVRKSFSKDRPKGSSRPVEVIKTIEESEKSSTDAEEEMGTDLPNTADYMDIFQPARALNRTPPPDLEQLENDMRDITDKFNPSEIHNSTTYAVVPNYDHRSTNHMKIPISSSESESTSPSAVSAPSSPKFKPALHRQLSCKDSTRREEPKSDDHTFHIPHSTSEYVLDRTMNRNTSKSAHNLGQSKSYYKDNGDSKYESTSGDSGYTVNKIIHSKSNHVNSKNNVRKKNPPRESVVKPTKPMNISDDVCENQLIPSATDRPVGLDMDDFLPKSHISMFENMSEQEVLSTMMGGHDKLITVLTGRQRNYQLLYSQWQSRDMKTALEYLGNLPDNNALLVDLLRSFITKPSMWDLDMCVTLLPQIHELLQSKYESYVQTGCESLRLILQNFASVIRSNVIAPVGSYGVDIPREERYAKCVKCHENLLQMRTFLLKRQTLQGKLGTIFRELQTMMQGIDS